MSAAGSASLVAGVDCSTQSTTVEVREAATGRLVASGRAPHPAVTPPIAEQHPEDWWRAFEAAWTQAGTPKVAAISVSGQQHGMVPLGADGEVLRPAKLWCDTTSAPDARLLIDRLEGGAASWARACGLVPVASFTVSKLAWLRRVEPAVFARMERVCLPHDWMTLRLTGGELVTDRGDASGTGYWGVAPDGSEGYVWSLLELVDAERDWTRAVPTVLAPSERAGRWSQTGAVVGHGAVVAPGTGDNMAAALGLGVAPGELVISIGTSGTAYLVSREPVADPEGAVAGFADATGRFLPLVCTLNAAKVTDAVARLLGVDHRELDRLALAAEPGAGGLVLLPYLDGERTPNRPDATGVLAGLRSDVTREQLARAAFEGVVCALLDAVDALVEQVAAADLADVVTLVGGGARSLAYRRILADLSGRAVRAPDLGETVALGACVQAAAVLEGAAPEQVRASWTLDAGARLEGATIEGGTIEGATIEPDPAGVERALAEQIRSRYRQRRCLEPLSLEDRG